LDDRYPARPNIKLAHEASELLRWEGLALGKIARKPSVERPCEPNHSPLPTTPNRTRTPPTNPNNDSRHHLRKVSTLFSLPIIIHCDLVRLTNQTLLLQMGKVHGSLARAGKVRSQCPKVAKQERTKKKLQDVVCTTTDSLSPLLTVEDEPRTRRKDGLNEVRPTHLEGITAKIYDVCLCVTRSFFLRWDEIQLIYSATIWFIHEMSKASNLLVCPLLKSAA
ncbi:hypothetical protein MJO28_005918, partial [Puccinia striiformis f. sp. tritici]